MSMCHHREVSQGYLNTDEQMRQLMSERLTKEEVREILTRLGAQEFGGPEESTLADVVEATDANPVTVARILADIRKEDWEERIGFILDDYAERLELLERTHQATPRKPTYVESREHPYMSIERDSPDEDVFDVLGMTDSSSQLARSTRNVFLIVLGVFLVVVFISCVKS